VNYYERHIGDYLKDTAHLSLLEHGVYTRLLDVYYTRDCGIDASDVARLIGARSKDEKAALQAVLSEFFVLQGGIYTQDRCDREIARYQDKQRKAKASADERWKQSKRNANASPDAMRTHSEGSTDGMHRAPVPSPQAPDTRPKETARAVSARDPDEPEDPGKPPTTRAGDACKRMKAAGLSEVNPGHPRLLALLAAGITDAELEAAAGDAVKRGKGFAYALAAVEGQRREAAAMEALPDAPAAQVTHWSETAGGVKAMGVSLGLTYTGLEQFSVYRAKVIEAKRNADEAMGVAA